MRALLEAAGAIFVLLGGLIALTAAWILVGGLLGWGGLQQIRPFDQQHGVYVPPPNGARENPR
jgi:hypothetical protein